MSAESIVAIVASFLALCGIGFFIFKRIPKRSKPTHFSQKWQDLQKLCKNEDDWNEAIIRADSLLDEALKRRRVTGKTMGERLVVSQKLFSDNDSVWRAHKLASHISQNNTEKQKENEVKRSLMAFRQALRDLGALL